MNGEGAPPPPPLPFLPPEPAPLKNEFGDGKEQELTDVTVRAGDKQSDGEVVGVVGDTSFAIARGCGELVAIGVAVAVAVA